MRIFFTMLLLGTAVPSCGALAEDCTDAVDQATMGACADKAYKKTDSELNTIYKEIIG